jgi:hypothetical protein
MFYLALYFSTIAASALGAALFLGGWQPPIAALGFIPGWVWFAAKTTVFVIFFMWLRGTLPRLRVDQLMGLAWKVLVPLALANLLVAGIAGNIAYNLSQSGPVGSFETTPIFTFLVFAIGNILLLALGVVLVTWSQGIRLRSAVRFAIPPRPAAETSA